MALKEEANLHLSTPISRLPQEIIDQFIDALEIQSGNSFGGWVNVFHHNKDIKTCMQVSRAFRSRARALLFSEIDIFPQPSPSEHKATANLREILEGDPALAHQVHTVRIELLVLRPLVCISIDDPSLPCILGMLPNIQKFGLLSHDGRCDWRSLSGDIKNAIFCLQDLPSLRTLDLFGLPLHIPVEVVTRWTNLTELRIHGSPFEDSPLSQSGVPAHIARRPIARLESMNSGTFFAMSMKILSRTCGEALFGRLKNLVLSVYQDDWQFFRPVLMHMQVRHSLETFDLSNLFTRSRMSDKPELLHFESPFLALHTLILREDNIHLTEPATSIVTLLCAFASAPTITIIRILIQWTVSEETSEWTPEKDELTRTQLLANTDPEAWSALDATLSHVLLFRLLEFDVRFRYRAPYWRERAGIEAAVSRQWTPHHIFPLLSSRDPTPPRIRLSFSQLDFD